MKLASEEARAHPTRTTYSQTLTSNNNELEILHETVNRLSAVSVLYYSYNYITLILIFKKGKSSFTINT